MRRLVRALAVVTAQFFLPNHIPHVEWIRALNLDYEQFPRLPVDHDQPVTIARDANELSAACKDKFLHRLHFTPPSANSDREAKEDGLQVSSLETETEG